MLTVFIRVFDGTQNEFVFCARKNQHTHSTQKTREKTTFIRLFIILSSINYLFAHFHLIDFTQTNSGACSLCLKTTDFYFLLCFNTYFFPPLLFVVVTSVHKKSICLHILYFLDFAVFRHQLILKITNHESLYSFLKWSKRQKKNKQLFNEFIYFTIAEDQSRHTAAMNDSWMKCYHALALNKPLPVLYTQIVDI